MIVLLIGSGAREHAIAEKLAQSNRVERVVVAPGNGGTDGRRGHGKIHNHPVDPLDFESLLDLAKALPADLTVVGPEAPLAAGIVDLFQAHDLAIFGPSQGAAQLEASKAFAKAFMAKNQIPTARFKRFDDLNAALDHLDTVPYPVVIKASGLAAGKGVVLPTTRAEAKKALIRMLVDGQFGAAGKTVIIEERLKGPEVSILAFCDGKSLRLLPPAQDHKRLLDGDRGPNTGGMGAFAPSPLISDDEIQSIHHEILEKTVAAMAQAGMPYRGVLYAGLMLTETGAKVLEFNCRFGDPEAQVLLPLLKNDLVEILLACIEGRLHDTTLGFHPGSALTVVAASGGYPHTYEKGYEISGLDRSLDGKIYHAGTQFDDENRLKTAGGRVLSLTTLGNDLKEAVDKAYHAMASIQFIDMYYRRDIGQEAANLVTGISYKDAGVDIDMGNRIVQGITESVESTHGPEVLAGVGAFGGLFDASGLVGMEQPILVASTDGVGTKTRIAAQMGEFRTLGYDLVNHCVNDILVQGAKPLFFLDYVAMSALDEKHVTDVIEGMAEACRESSCALLGGETAEMPGVYQPGEMDVVGTIIGVVNRPSVVDGQDIVAGDRILGLASTGLHTNGYALARKVLEGRDLKAVDETLGQSLGAALLAPHRCYLKAVDRLKGAFVPIKGLVHITGGGLIENPPRVIPEDLAAEFNRAGWQVPRLFQIIQDAGKIEDLEMARVFNMGIGMLVVVPAEESQWALGVLEQIGVEAFDIGCIKPRGDGEAVQFI